MKSKNLVRISLILAAVATGAALWHFWPRANSFYTDAQVIREPVKTASPRDILWQPPARLPDFINFDGDNYEPRISADGLKLFFVHGKAGQNADIFAATKDRGGWNEPQPLSVVNSGVDELGPEPSASGTELYFYSDREGGLGGYDLWVSRRADDQWQTPENLGSAVNSAFNDYGPALTPDGATLYFASNRPAMDDAGGPVPNGWSATLREDFFHRTYDLYAAALVSGTFSPASPLKNINTTWNEGAPAVSAFGDFIYFASDRPGGAGGFDLYRSRVVRGEIQSSINLGSSLNTAANELDPGLSLGGYALHFSSDRSDEAATRPPATRTYALYQSTSREVFTESELVDRSIDWAGLWTAVGPNLLWALLALLALLAMWGLFKVGKDRKLSLITKCLLASLAAHLGLMFLLNTWQVTTKVMGALHRGPIQISLGPGVGGNSALAMQLGGGSGESLAVPGVELGTSPRLSIRHAPNQESKQVLLGPGAQPLALSAPAARLEFAASDSRMEHASTIPQMIAQPVSFPQQVVTTALPENPTSHAQPDSAMPLPASSEKLASSNRFSTQQIVRAPSPNLIHTPVPSRVASGDAHAGRSFIDPVLAVDSERPPAEQITPVAGEIQVPAATQSAGTQLVVAMPGESAWPAALEDTPFDALASGTLSIESAASNSRMAVHRADTANSGRGAAGNPLNSVAVALPGRAVEFGKGSMVGSIVERVVSVSGGDSGSATSGSLQASSGSITAGDSITLAVKIPGSSLGEIGLPWETGKSGGNIQVATGDGVEKSLPAVNAGEMIPTARRLGDIHGTGVGPRSGVGTASTRTLEVPTGKGGVANLGGGSSALMNAIPRDSRGPVLGTSLTGGAVSNSATTAASGTASRLVDLALPAEQTAPSDAYASRAAPERMSLVERMGGGEDTERAVALALQWLAKHQSADGHWDGKNFDAGCGACGDEMQIEADHALTGLSLLCFLGAGHTHTKDGMYRDHVQRGIKWLVSKQKDDGDLRGGESMYSQGIATIALAEALAMTGDATLVEIVNRAAGFIIKARDSSTGGWRYDPGTDSDTSVLGWQIMALKSASRAGVKVPSSVWSAAKKWLGKVSRKSKPGLYAYQPGEDATPSMTAEGLFVRQLLGESSELPHMRGSIAYVLKNLPEWENANTYYWYYATLAMFQAQGEAWEKWNTAITRVLLTNQRTDGPAAGSWNPEGEWAQGAGRIYQTALCTLMLEVYYRYLPLYSLEQENIGDESTEVSDLLGKVRGKVFDASTGLLLPGARVRLDLPDRASINARTDASGAYSLSVPQVPEFFALSASHTGYVPMSANVSRSKLIDGIAVVNFSLDLEGDDVVAVEAVPDVHHLGDDHFDGAINSQFQKRSEGDSFEAEFQLDEAHLSQAAAQAQIRLLAKGVQRNHSMYINDVRLEKRLNQAPADGSFGEFVASFDSALLQEGYNTVRIVAAPSDSDIDDFEFVNVRIVLPYGAAKPVTPSMAR